MSEGGRQWIVSKVWIGATLQTFSEGGRQRLGARWNSEQLLRGPVLEREPEMVKKCEGRELGGKSDLLASFGELCSD